MTKKEKAHKIGEILDQLYPKVTIPLQHRDPFTLLVAVVLSAQSTDKKVNEITPQLFSIAPTPEAMSQLKVETIENLIKPIGLAPQKARNLHALSIKLLETFSGQVPSRREDLLSLPGVGPKTAAVVLSQAFGIPAFPVDTHIHRLATRWGLTSGKNVTQTEKDLKKVFPRESWSKRHLQFIYFGRQYCKARFHDSDRCPICSWAAPKA